MLRSQYGISIVNGTVRIDTGEILRNNVNLTGTNITIPTANLTNTLEGALPGVDAAFINDLDLTLVNDETSPLNGLNLRDLVDGDVLITLE